MQKELDREKETLDIGRRIVVFIGPEGSGKSTVAKRLSSESGKPYISTGDIIRDLTANDEGELGDACRKMFAEHAYLSSKQLLQILEHRIKEKDTKNGCIIDGGMRVTEETEGFPAMLEHAGRSLPVTVVSLRVPAWLGAQRLIVGRKRSDDTVEGVLKRLSNFYFEVGKRTALMESFGYELLHINAMGTPDEVFNNVLKNLIN